MTALAQHEIALTESFDDVDGGFPHYDAYSSAQRAQIRKQRHRDIRCFQHELGFFGRLVGDLDVFTMTDLDGFTLDDPGALPTMELVSAVTYDEGWTVGTIAADPTRNHWSKLSVTCPIGTTTTASVAAVQHLDLLNDFTDSDIISVALPAFPLASLNLASSNISIGAWDGATTTILLNDAAVSGLVAGNSAMELPRSRLFNSLGPTPRAAALSAIRSVTFTFVATGACTVTIMAIRLLSTDWLYAPVDINTLTQRLVRPVSLNGSASPTIAFPANTFTAPLVPNDFPILLRSDTPSSINDPRPIDVSLAAVFDSGTFTDAGSTNTIKLFFRETSQDIITMLDLETAGTTMADLDALGHQPDFGQSLWRSRLQDDLDPLSQEQLDALDQSNLDAAPDSDPLAASWLEVDLTWTDTGATVTIEDTANVYSYPVTLTVGTTYVMLVEVDTSVATVRIYPIDTHRIVDYSAAVFNVRVSDDGVIVPRRGRFGWYAHFTNGDAWLAELTPYRTNFGEYRSRAFESFTPVDGAQLFWSGSSRVEHWTGVQGLNGAVVLPDATKSQSGRAFSVSLDGTQAGQGVVTNSMQISDFGETVVSFDLFFPSTAGDFLACKLVNEFGEAAFLNLGALITDRWQHVELSLSFLFPTLLPGVYTLELVRPDAVHTVFYVDNISVSSAAISWFGRGELPDPWGDDDLGWSPFGTLYNAQTAGVMFPQRGRHLQVRGIARISSADLYNVRVIPRYATLGRLVWTDERVDPVAPTVTYTDSAAVRTYTFTNTTTPSVSGKYIAAATWDLGNGAVRVGNEIVYTFPSAGTFPVTLTVVQDDGAFGALTQAITVT